MSNSITHEPLEVTLNWTLAGDDAFAYATTEHLPRTVSVGEVIENRGSFTAYWFGFGASHIGSWLGDYPHQSSALAAVEDHASRLVVSL